jgi:hypothetical protein
MKQPKRYFYWNLHQGLWSCMVQGKVRGRYDSVVANDVEFRVRPGGHARVLREGRKNVHAFAIADSTVSLWNGPSAMTADDFNGLVGWIEVSYNPFKGATFYRKDDGSTVTRADQVALTSDKRVFARGVR